MPLTRRHDEGTAPFSEDPASPDGRRLRVLHVILMVGPTNGQYNEHCLPLMDVRDLAVCTFFPPQLVAPAPIAMFPGDGTIPGFVRALRSAMDAGPYDIVHVHAPQSGALFPITLIALRRFRTARRSLVYTVQDSFYDYSLRDQSLMVASMPAYARVIFCSRRRTTVFRRYGSCSSAVAGASCRTASTSIGSTPPLLPDPSTTTRGSSSLPSPGSRRSRIP